MSSTLLAPLDETFYSNWSMGMYENSRCSNLVEVDASPLEKFRWKLRAIAETL